MNRRNFLGAAAGAAAFSSFRGARAATGPRLPIKKGVLITMLPKNLSHLDQFKLAREVGFQAVQCITTPDQQEALEIKEASRATGLLIPSVMNMDHWKYPLSSADPAVVERSMKGMETSLRNAHLWGAKDVLLVPAVVNAETRYEQAWERSQKQIRKLLPLAKKLKVIIAVEEVWNKFLLSPLEFVRYIDDFNSPWVKAFLDVGNMVLYGYPQDWIRTLGKRIADVHLKDFRSRSVPGTPIRLVEFVPLRKGDINWKEVYRAFAEVGYHGTATVELPATDKLGLQEINRRVDLILNGA